MEKRLHNLILFCTGIAILLFIIGVMVNLFAFIVGVLFFSSCLCAFVFREQIKEINDTKRGYKDY